MTDRDHSGPTPAQRRYRGRAFEERRLADGQAYREISALAVWSLACGALSWLTVFSWVFVPLPVAGLVLGYLALRQIRQLPGEMTGRGLAVAGLALSGGLWLLGSGYMVFCVVAEVPIGYTRLEFKDLQPDPQNESELVPKEIIELEDENVYVKGYMYPGRQVSGIQQFVLVPTLGHCKFCQRELKTTEMIEVRMVGDVLANFSVHPTGVGGKLKIRRQDLLSPLGGIAYEIEADYLFQ